jgi:thiol-disulfide isomerase/thioredoxin
MANLVTYINSLLKPYYKYILGFLIVLVFVMIARYSFQVYFARQNKNKKLANVANANNTAPIKAVYFFHVDWCPHCIKAQPEWKSFSDQFDNKEIGGYLVRCYDIDCTEDHGDEVIQFDPTNDQSPTGIKPTSIKISELVQKYKIESYPTIKMTKDDLVIDFDAKVTHANLSQFVNSV